MKIIFSILLLNKIIFIILKNLILNIKKYNINNF